MSLKKRSYTSYTDDSNRAPPNHAPFANFGTPLPAYDSEVRDDGSYVPVWKQEVTDEHGRKRLHGAFTGGWSAGYFNTVGSKEGWTPSSFVSSRSNRANKANDGTPKLQKPEDFMDEEDLALQEESQKLETVGTFAGLGNTAPESSRGMFGDFFKPTHETMGLKLLQKMGWRQGQGIGPKIRRRALGDKSGDVHFFAPENSKIVHFVRKTDRHGVDYDREDKLGLDNKECDETNSDQDASILKRNRSKVAVKPGKLKKKTGIGIGVLNDTGSDDDDSYEMGPSLSYSRMVGGDKKKRKKKSGIGDTGSEQSAPLTKTLTRKGPDRTGSLVSSKAQRCHDGRLPLTGFTLSLNSLQISQATDYPPTPVPDGWKSTKKVDTEDRGREAYQSTAEAAKVSLLTANNRAAMLGEQQLPGKSIFDFISPAVRDKIANAARNKNLPQGRGEHAPENSYSSSKSDRRTLWDLVPLLSKDTATAALHRIKTGFTPYEDESKCQRYRYFLELRAGLQQKIPDRPNGFNLEEWGSELKEFAQAAAVFKPMSGLMALRFTTSKGSSKVEGGRDTVELEIEENPAEKAARMGMFGALTRQRYSFFPTRLLCKRFGVIPPANAVSEPPDGAFTGKDSASGMHGNGNALDVLGQDSVDRILHDSSSQALAKDNVKSLRGDFEDLDTPVADVDVERNQALEASRADESVLKAIFGDGDEHEL